MDDTENILLKDALLSRVRVHLPLMHGERKVLFEFYKGILLAVRLPNHLYGEKNLIGKTPEEIVEGTRDSLQSFLESTTCLTTTSFGVPLHRLSLRDHFGQPILQTPSISHDTPAIALHRKEEGKTLKSFYQTNREKSFEIMAKWPQKTFDDFMEMMAHAARLGHGVDWGTSGNFMVQNIASESPRLIPIDLLFNLDDTHRENYTGSEKAMLVFRKRDCTSAPPQQLIDKLVLAAQNAQFGIHPSQIEKAAKLLKSKFGTKMGESIFGRLKDIPPISFDAQEELPKPLKDLSTLAINAATLSDLRAYIVKLKAADKAAYPDRYSS